MYLCIFSLCNTSATSKQALLLHAEGKKHRAKARAFHAAKQPPKQTEESNPDTKLPTGNTRTYELLDNEHSKEPKLQDPPKADTEHYNSKADKGTSPSKKKRKLDASVNDNSRKKTKNDTSGDLGNGEVIHSERALAEETKSQLKNDKVAESRSNKEQTKKKIKWKKLITSALKSVCIFNNNLVIFPFHFFSMQQIVPNMVIHISVFFFFFFFFF